MERNRIVFIFNLLFFIVIGNAQRIDIKGQLLGSGDLEGIHILNRTALKYTVSNENGSFTISAKVNDTLNISSLRYKKLTVVILASTIKNKFLSVQLTENINQLSEVFVGDQLTGSLGSDLENAKAKAKLNFYDLGIPGYTGIPLTQNEQKLSDADHGHYFKFYGIGLAVNVNKVLNKISGRTKKLKENVALEYKRNCLNRIRRDYEALIFENEVFAEDLKHQYFYFCDEDPQFAKICKEQNDLKMIEFLNEKLMVFKSNIKPLKDN